MIAQSEWLKQAEVFLREISEAKELTGLEIAFGNIPILLVSDARILPAESGSPAGAGNYYTLSVYRPTLQDRVEFCDLMKHACVDITALIWRCTLPIPVPFVRRVLKFSHEAKTSLHLWAIVAPGKLICLFRI